MQNIPGGEKGCQNLTDYGGNGCTHHAPSEKEDKDRVQNDVGDGADQSGRHCKFGISVCPDDWVHCLAEHIKWDSQSDVEEIFLGVIESLFIDCAAEHGNDLILKNQIDHSQYQTAYDAENYSVSNAFLAEAVSPLPRQMLTNAQQPSPIITAIARATTVNGNTTVFAALP